MKIAIGCDHAGINLKPAVIKYLEENGHEYKDFGTYTTDSCDYPDYALAVAEAVSSQEYDRGILICGTGIGMSIAANKVKGIRCAHVQDTFSAKATREHNNANIIAFGERLIGVGVAVDIVDAYLKAEFLGGRHQKRVDKILQIEAKYGK